MNPTDMEDAFESEFNNLTDDVEEVATDFYDNPGSDELDRAYRLMHTLKGNCFTAGYEAMGDLVHTFEDVLGDLKETNRDPSAEIGDLLLDVNDQLKSMYENDIEDVPDDLVNEIESILEDQDADDSETDGSEESDTEDQSSGGSRSTGSTSVEINEIPVSIEQVDDLFRKSENLRAELLDRGEKVLMQEAGKISRSLLDMRLIRPKSIVPKLKRLVRSTSKDLDDKEINFEISGENNQASASVIEDLSKILPHLLKNSIDHGIESKSEREQKDKEPTGTVELSFEQVASSFVVKVSDDGAGLDADRIEGLDAEYEGADVDVLVRPDDIRAVPADPAGTNGRIVDRQYTGPSFVYTVELDSGAVLHCEHNHAEELGIDKRVRVRLATDHPLAWFPAE